MAELSPSDFAEFFEAFHKHKPFPWQRMLLERIAAGADWPQVVDLPTASGKTACIDIAVFILALQAELAPLQRTARRRIFFVVDRRIVVDEAFERAEKIANKLAEAESGILKSVADRLRHISHGEMPLAVAKLRGGTARTRQRWSENPLQPAVITSTVDQIGSRLLFRSYGGSPLIAPVHAALAAYDSLIILDEAHCAQPFLQTVSSVRSYLDSDKWSLGKVPIAPPLKLMIMSATAPLVSAAGGPLEKFPNAEQRIAALNAPEITGRSAAVKSARLESIDHGGNTALVKRASASAREAISGGCKRIAVMVNRVNLASEIATAIKVTRGLPPCDVVLLTGRMRPIDRDDLVDRWSRFLRAAEPEEPPRPILVVTTQCLEVGADFSFDHLITQCASIDALIQRFGRLDRLGLSGRTNAVILATKDDVSDRADDPIYGKAITETWKWLLARSKLSPETETVNFAINAIGEQVRLLEHGILNPMLAPHSEAPVLMPSHVDILCQTAPHPAPDIDVSAYLHGVGRGQPEVRIAFRLDIASADGKLGDDDESCAAYSHLFELCPPKKQECLGVPISRLMKYLLGQTTAPAAADDEDVEGAVVAEDPNAESGGTSGKQFLRHRNGDWKAITASASRDLIRPNDLIILMPRDQTIPAALGTNLDGAPIDRAEGAAWIGRPQETTRRSGGVFVRISKSVLGQSSFKAASRPLLEWLDENRSDENTGGPDLDSLKAALATVAEASPATEESSLVRFTAICKAAARVVRPKQLKPHPIENGSWIVAVPGDLIDIEDTAADEDAGSYSREPMLLAGHLADVRVVAKQFATGLPSGLAKPLEDAAGWHDLGKLDPRFQEILGNTNNAPLAKSDNEFWRKTDFRHEMISLQIVQNCLAQQLPVEEIPRELLLHLIAAHHGHARPFAPVRDDSDPEDILAPDGFDPAVKLTAEARNRPPKPHHLGSGIPDRFWFLTRHFGWWGLAYLESILRLADWEASAHPSTAAIAAEETPEEVHS